MTSCVQNLLTMLAVPLSIVLAVGLMSALSEAYTAVKRFFDQFEVSLILVPAAALALAIFLVRYELPKHVEIVQCGAPTTSVVACR